MANYNGNIRTNYFNVTDVDKFHQLMLQVQAEDSVHIFEDQGEGSAKFAFGSYGLIFGIEMEDECPNLGLFYEGLQKILPHDDAILIMEAGNEKLRYLIGACTIITNNEIRYVNMQEAAIEQARDMLQNPNFTTKMEY